MKGRQRQDRGHPWPLNSKKMLQADLELSELKPEEMSDEEFVPLNVLKNCIQAEAWPHKPFIALSQTIHDRRTHPPLVEVQEWVVSQIGVPKVVGTAKFAILLTPENKHIGEFKIAVLPERRQQGIGRALLSHVAQAAEVAQRRLLITYSTTPDGEAFMRRLGGHVGLTNHVNRLELRDLNKEIMWEWLKRGRRLADEYEVGTWEGPYPEADLEVIARLHTVMNSAPRGELEIEDSRFMVEQLRDLDATLLQQEVQRWTLYVRHRQSGTLAGFTQVLWRSSQPSIMQWEATGVFPEHRNQGLGRWLKATMIEKVLRERPQVAAIHTGNATSNEAILHINEQLGFKPYGTSLHWQISLEQVLKYLSE